MDDYLSFTQDRPTTRKRVCWHLGGIYADFLRETGVDSEAVTIHTLNAWQKWLQALPGGYTSSRDKANGSVRSYYRQKGGLSPETKWAGLAQQLSVLPIPEVMGEAEPHQPFALALIPKILEASGHVAMFEHGGTTPVYSEAYALTATFVYTGGRAQFYGIRDEQVLAALQTGILITFVKGGKKPVPVPIHDRLRAIWKDHLEHRDFDGPQFFRNGRYPYTYHEGNRVWQEDDLAANSNDIQVSRILRGPALKKGLQDGVERQLELRYGIKETITSHRFRVSMGTYMELYGFTSAERRLQLSHGAKTITDAYSKPMVAELQRKISAHMDLGSKEWVAAHDPPVNLFGNNGNGAVDAAVLEELRALRANADLQAKDLRELREELKKERERNRELTDEILRRKAEPRVVA